MPKDLITNRAFTVGLGPGAAVEFRPLEVMAFPDEIADRLLRIPGVSVAPAGVDARRVTLKERSLAPELAAVLSPPHDQATLDAAAEKRALRLQVQKLEAELEGMKRGK